VAALLAGCGGSDGPHLARADAAPLISLSHRIAREGACAQARDIRTLQRRAVGLVNRRRVPAALQETFLSGVNALADQAPACVPAVPPAVVPARSRVHGHGHKGHGKHGN
jgi:hypothetical protein